VGEVSFRLTSSPAFPVAALMWSGRGRNAHSLQGFLLAGSGAVRADQQQGWTRQPVKKGKPWSKPDHLEQKFMWFCPTSTLALLDNRFNCAISFSPRSCSKGSLSIFVSILKHKGASNRPHLARWLLLVFVLSK